ncbi:MAG TPA: glycosyltransferase [Chloroflexota bacterium]|nr:glycosyltransferase [Chloroflexota bacterium]
MTVTLPSPLRAGTSAGRPQAGLAAQLILGAGAVGLAIYNARRWAADRALAARLQAALADAVPPLTGTPRVSILVAAWNEAAFLERHIRSVLALRYPNKEYVLCAGGSDGTLEIARRYAGSGVIVLEQRAGEGKQRALQQAYREASGAIIFLTDADCLLDDAGFERALEPIINGSEAATTGSSMPLAEQRGGSDFALYQWAVQQYSLANQPPYGEGLLGRNAAIRRDALEAAGAFSAPVPTGTDYHLAKALLRRGYRIRSVPASLVATPYATAWSRYARQQRRWLRNVTLLGARFGAWHEVRASLQTSLLGAAMLIAPGALLIGTVLGRLGASARRPAGGALAGAVVRLVFVMWCLAMVHSSLAKVRYLAFGRLLAGQGPIGLRHAATAVQYTLGEFAVWALPLLDYPHATRRRRW